MWFHFFTYILRNERLVLTFLDFSRYLKKIILEKFWINFLTSIVDRDCSNSHDTDPGEPRKPGMVLSRIGKFENKEIKRNFLPSWSKEFVWIVSVYSASFIPVLIRALGLESEIENSQTVFWKFNYGNFLIRATFIACLIMFFLFNKWFLC